MLKLLLAAVLLVTAETATAEGADWDVVSRTANVSVDIERSTLARDGNQVSVWFRERFSTPQSISDDAAQFNDVRFRISVDCRDFAATVVSTLWTSNGQPVARTDERMPIVSAAPDTALGDVASKVCGPLTNTPDDQ
ncbi:surface-adhesin E family protein [Pararobbsia alpina]|uniref:surface-adhesin E family protein n=1 Tax=Pararobbsia alpina TaxID=621374 RepID=UPI0039A74113